MNLRNQPFRRRWGVLRLLGLFLVLGVVAAACGGGDDDGGTAGPGDEGEPQRGGELTIGLEAESNSWLPGRANWASPGDWVARSFYDPLLARGDDGEMHPFLAESIEPNDDFSEWTLTLREGVEFHDGTPLNSEALKTVFDDYLKVEGSNTAGALSNVSSMEIVDDLTVTYMLERGNAHFPDLLDGAIGMPFSPTAAEEAGEDAGDNPVGTGAFEFVSWQRDNRLVVERNEDWWFNEVAGTDLPYVDRIVWRPIPDEDTRLQSLLAGDVDLMQSLRQSIVKQTQQAADGGQIQQVTFIGNNGGGAIYNTLTPPVDDARVRQALVWALDQEALVQVLGGLDVTPPQTQFFSEESPWWSQEVADAYPDFDQDRAGELLQSYIDDPERSDGRSPGSPISVEFNCPPDPSLIELSQAYQRFWQDVGVEVNLNSVEQAAHIQNAIGAPDQDPPFRGTYMVNCWRMGSQDHPYTTWRNFFGPQQNPLNFTNYNPDELLGLIDELRVAEDVGDQEELVEEISLMIAEEIPVSWTGATATIIGFANNVHGVEAWTMPDGSPGEGMVAGATAPAWLWTE